ncbi:MAG: QueT transporter family protein [Oscillospiraceae bacterium]|jgi:uncharacterized membrane protein
MKHAATRKLTASAVIAALYAVLTMIDPLAYGQVQFRISEVLCVLPFFFPYSAFGLTVGCMLANLLGPYTVVDAVFGSLATLLAGLCTAALGKRYRETQKAGWVSCLLVCLMPVLFNAVIVGAEIAIFALFPGSIATLGGFFTGAEEVYRADPGQFWGMYGLCALGVALGEAVILYALGLPAMRYLLKNPRLSGMLRQLQGDKQK